MIVYIFESSTKIAPIAGAQAQNGTRDAADEFKMLSEVEVAMQVQLSHLVHEYPIHNKNMV